MNRISFVYKGKRRHYSGPREWNDLTGRQLFIWAGIIRMAVPLERAMQAAVMLMYGIPARVLAVMPEAYDMQLRLTLAFLKERNLLTKNVIGGFRLFGRYYHGPANRLSNLTIGEYRRTELYYQLYIHRGDKQLLRLLAATLFRPKGKGGGDDVREPVSEVRINRRASLFRWLHPNRLHSILLFYEGCRADIIARHPLVFKAPANGEEKAGKAALLDFDEQILAYAGDKLGSYVETAATNLFVFLKHMSKRIEEYERMKRK